MGMMIKQNKSVVETAKREELLKAAQTLKEYCASSGAFCNDCLFRCKGCLLQDVEPAKWKVSSIPLTREEMERYVKVYGHGLHFARNGRTTAVLWCGELYAVTRYYKDAEDELIAHYELLKKIFG